MTATLSRADKTSAVGGIVQERERERERVPCFETRNTISVGLKGGNKNPVQTKDQVLRVPLPALGM